jgi:uncharacterized protein YdeI (YjbR/CyaY-like superfamily)
MGGDPSSGEGKLLRLTRRGEWRGWLQSHHRRSREAWLLLFNSRHRQGSLSLNDAVEEALCFGWIDGTLRRLDEKRYALRFTPRKPGSVWSVRNIARVRKLTRLGLMAQAGLEAVANGRRSGEWDAALSRETPDILPPDLERALLARKGAMAGYTRLSQSRKKQILHWLTSAKRTETRVRRIDAVVAEVVQER